MSVHIQAAATLPNSVIRACTSGKSVQGNARLIPSFWVSRYFKPIRLYPQFSLFHCVRIHLRKQRHYFGLIEIMGPWHELLGNLNFCITKLSLVRSLAKLTGKSKLRLEQFDDDFNTHDNVTSFAQPYVLFVRSPGTLSSPVLNFEYEGTGSIDIRLTFAPVFTALVVSGLGAIFGLTNGLERGSSCKSSSS
jgi:hypothetical protein